MNSCGDNFAPVPRNSIKVPHDNSCFEYPMLFNCQNPQPKVNEFVDYYSCNDADKELLCKVVLKNTAFRLREILKIQKTNVDFQQRYRIILVTLSNVMIEAIVFLNRYGQLTVESRYFYQVSQIVVD